MQSVCPENVTGRGASASGSPSGAAAACNAFLGDSGLHFNAYWNGVQGLIPIGGSHQVLLTRQGEGLYGIDDSPANGNVPEPSGLLLLGGGLAVLFAVRRTPR